MNFPDAHDVLWERRLAFCQRQRCLASLQGPVLTPQLTWPAFWEQIDPLLRSCGYRRSSRRQYRHSLRLLRASGVHRPVDLTAARAGAFIHGLVASHASWSWISLNIAVMRTVFDKLCGASVTVGLVTPKRGFRLPEILSEAEAVRLVRCGNTIRDQLVLGLLYGCGLTGSELSRLRWRDILTDGKRLHVPRSTRYLERIQPVPEPLHQLLRTGIETCEPDDYLFHGRSEGRALSTRMVEIIVRRAKQRAGIERPMTVMSLRHSYAVHRLQHGANLRQVQNELGHASIRTTQRYRHCLTPPLERHPFTTVRKLMAQSAAGLDSEPSGSQPTRDRALPEKPPAARQRSPARRPLDDLKSIDIRDLRLPFGPSGSVSPAAAFMQRLKSRFLGSFLKRPQSYIP